jgi:probable addiction module antidote protein
MTGKRKTPETLAFEAKHRDPAAIAKYLNRALSTRDTLVIIRAVGEMVRAQGPTRFAEKSGLRRDNLYRTFSGERRPPFDYVMNVLMALEVELVAKPTRERGEAPPVPVRLPRRVRR